MLARIENGSGKSTYDYKGVREELFLPGISATFPVCDRLITNGCESFHNAMSPDHSNIFIILLVVTDVQYKNIHIFEFTVKSRTMQDAKLICATSRKMSL